MSGNLKKLMLDLNVIFQGCVEKKARGGVFWTEYEILKEFLRNHSDKFEFYADCVCTEDYYNNVLLKEFPEFKSIKYVDILSPCSRFQETVIFYVKLFKFKKNSTKNFFKRAFYFFATSLFRFSKIFKVLFSKKVNNSFEIDYYQTFMGTTGLSKDIQDNDRIKKYAFIYDVMPITNPEYFFKKNKIKKSVTSFSKKMKTLRKDTIIFSDSINAKDEFIKVFPEYSDNKIIINYLAADKNKFYPNSNIDKNILSNYKIPTDKKYILSLSSLNKRKNLSFLVDSFVDFLDSNKNIDDLYLVLAGPGGWLMDEMLNSIKNAKAYKDKIILTGFVDQKDINTLYNGAFCFIFPSLAEGFGLPVLEAMQCGIPTISSNTTSLPEVYGDAAIGINPTKKEELIKAIGNLYLDEQLRKKLSNNGLERSTKFNWKNAVDIMVAEYK